MVKIFCCCYERLILNPINWPTSCPAGQTCRGIGGNPYLSIFRSTCKMVDNQMAWIAEVNKILQCHRIWIHRIWIQITARSSNGRFHKIRSSFNSRLCDVSSRHRGRNSKTNLHISPLGLHQRAKINQLMKINLV